MANLHQFCDNELWFFGKSIVAFGIIEYSSSSRRHLADRPSSSNRLSTSSSRSRASREGVDKSSANASFAPTESEEAGGGGVFEEEPTLNQGVFSALLLAQKKGYVEEEKEKEVSGAIKSCLFSRSDLLSKFIFPGVCCISCCTVYFQIICMVSSFQVLRSHFS